MFTHCTQKLRVIAKHKLRFRSVAFGDIIADDNVDNDSKDSHSKYYGRRKQDSFRLSNKWRRHRSEEIERKRRHENNVYREGSIIKNSSIVIVPSRIWKLLVMIDDGRRRRLRSLIGLQSDRIRRELQFWSREMSIWTSLWRWQIRL